MKGHSMKSTVLAGVVFTLALASVRAQESGSVEGQIMLVQKTAQGEKRILHGKDLAAIVAYLVPEGHNVPLKVPLARPRVSQKGAKFQPLVLGVVQGQTVDFPNDDEILHNVFSFSKPKRFDLGLYKKGVTKSVTFDQPGPVALFCSIHSNMNGFVYVSPTHLFGLSDEKGRFTIKDVPVGKYKVFTWHRHLPQGTESIEITELAVQKGEKIAVTIDLGTVEEDE